MSESVDVTAEKKKRATPARRRAWKRTSTEQATRVDGTGDGGQLVALTGEIVATLSNGRVSITVTGPAAEVDALADRMLRELPEGR